MAPMPVINDSIPHDSMPYINNENQFLHRQIAFHRAILSGIAADRDVHTNRLIGPSLS